MLESLALWSKGMRRISVASGLAVLGFLYLPILALITYSFSKGPALTFPILGLTFDWYRKLSANQDLLHSIGNSLFVAGCVVPLTLLLGVPAAYALSRFAVPGGRFLERLLMLPLMIPGLLTGLSVLLILKRFGFELSLWAVVLGHGVAWLPIVVGQVMARLGQLDRRIEEASMDLGAGPARTFFKIVVPNIRNAIIGSALLVFALSFDEIAITFMLTGSENTLPMYIWASLRRGVTPEICAVASVAVTASIALLLLGLSLTRKSGAD
jgi:spermidine/putrescine transport system permease protein